jgi:membrane protein YqaA with SNARE-associated domain
VDGSVLELWGLFTGAFLSATLLPGGSEAALAFLDHRGGHPVAVLLAVATAGNALGGMSSWLIGRVLPARRLEGPDVQRALERVRRFGSPILLLAWLPLVGDPLCVAAGWLRVPWLAALIFITAGKAARYAAVVMLA